MAKGSKRQAAQAVFGSVYGKQQSNADAQIRREIARLEAQYAKRPKALSTPSDGEIVPVYHRYP